MRRNVIIALVTSVWLLIVPPLFAADESDTQQATVGGTVPELCQLTLGGNWADTMLNLTQDSSEPYYDQGYIGSSNPGTALQIDANKAWDLKVNYNGAGWTCPGNYNKAETDLSLKISNTPTGTIQNGYNNYKSPPSSQSPEVMLSHTSGVSNNDVWIMYQVLLDWTKDIPGAYSIILTYTLSTTGS